jgi:hypothetical protein
LSGPDFCLSCGCSALRSDGGCQGKDLLRPVHFHDDKRYIVFGFTGPPEQIQCPQDPTMNVTGRFCSVLTNNVPDGLLSEHFSIRGPRFPDTVGTDNDDLSGLLPGQFVLLELIIFIYSQGNAGTEQFI